MHANILQFYGVTNWHVANDLGASIIRINTQDGKARFIELGPEDWHFPKRGDDLSIAFLGGHEQEADQIGHYRIDTMILDDAFVRHTEIGVGEDVFMLGLYAEQHGGERNTPAIRFGNLSLLADERAPIEQPNGIMRPSHLVDMRSRTGFSGSPVVLYRIPDNDLSDIPARPPRHLPCQVLEFTLGADLSCCSVSIAASTGTKLKCGRHLPRNMIVKVTQSTRAMIYISKEQ